MPSVRLNAVNEMFEARQFAHVKIRPASSPQGLQPVIEELPLILHARWNDVVPLSEDLNQVGTKGLLSEGRAVSSEAG